MQPLQVFNWTDFSHQDYEQQRTYYKGFTLQEESYSIGDCVLLLPEIEGSPHHLGCIQAAFSDCSPEANDSHSIEVRWFERFTSLFPSERGLEKELVELEEVDVNPIGCLVGRACIIRAKTYEEAEQLGKEQLDGDWFFSRGMFKQSLNQFSLYTDIDAGAQLLRAHSYKKRSSTEPPEEMADSDDACASRPPSRAFSKRKARMIVSDDDADDDELDDDHVLSGSKGSNGKQFGKGPGKQCVECGATQTPQWREGPAGPKTLCNACGVRYNRLRSSKRNGMGQRQQSARSKLGKHASPKEVAPSVGHASTRRSSPELSYASELLGPSATTAAMAPVPLSTAAGRPMRQAALLAANRTAAFARTGVFPMEDDGRVGHSYYAHHPNRAASSGGSLQEEDVSHHSSESAEDLLFPLEQQGMLLSAADALLSAGSSIELSMLIEQQHAAGLAVDASVDDSMTAPEPTPISDEDTASLMDLAAQCKYGLVRAATTYHSTTDLCQHMLESSPEDASPAGSLTPPPVSAAGNRLRSVALRAVGFCPDVAEFGEVFASFEAVCSRLPEDVVTQLLGVGELVDSAANEAVAADAALQAVEQILCTRQKAADSARQKASDAVDRFKGCMADLLQQHSVGLLGTPMLGPSAGSALLPAGMLLLSECGSIGEGAGGKSISSVLSCWGMDEHTGLLGDMNVHRMMDGGAMDMMGASLLHHMDFGSFGSSAELIEVEN